MVPKLNKIIMREACNQCQTWQLKQEAQGSHPEHEAWGREWKPKVVWEFYYIRIYPQWHFSLHGPHFLSFSKWYQQLKSIASLILKPTWLLSVIWTNSWWRKKLCREAFRCLSIWVTGKNAYTRIIFMRENGCLMICFNFYFVCQCVFGYMHCPMVPKDRPCSLLDF